MDLSTIIAKYSLWIALVVIIIFLFYNFFIKPKYLREQKPLDQYAPFLKETLEKESIEQKQKPLERIGRGFKVMHDKIKNSDYIKGIQEEQENSDPDEFSTDLSNLGGTKL